MGIAALHPSYDSFFRPRDGLLRFARNDGEIPKHHNDRHTPRRRGIQYAAAYRFNHCCLWNTGSPAFAG